MQEFRKGIESLEQVLKEVGCRKFLLVCDSSFQYLSIKDRVLNCGTENVMFNQFSSNPLHSDADKGLSLLSDGQIDAIVAVGGGSSIDVAKCIKLDSNKWIPLIAIPTTAGTGSESTKHIVVYKDGKKESLGNDSVIPNYVIFEPKVLLSLPDYQKKCTMLDALSQGIESWWSINSTDESKGYSSLAITGIIGNYARYLKENDLDSAAAIMEAANYSGRAINITQTTAPHAMSYKLSSMYSIPHGHAVAVCFPHVWQYMTSHLERCIDKRGQEYLLGIWQQISVAMGCNSTGEAIARFQAILDETEINNPASNKKNEDLNVLADSVNPVRLKNNPIELDRSAIISIYDKVVDNEC